MQEDIWVPASVNTCSSISTARLPPETPGAQYVPESTKLALKERATLVTANVDDDGIYKACEQLGLFD